MTTFLLRRLLALIPLLVGVSFIVFGLISLAPGDFLDAARAQRDIPPELIEAQEKEFGLNEPFIFQYARWLGNALTLDFGYSWTYRVPVVDLITSRLGATFLLSLCAIIFAWTIAIPLGVLAAIYKDSIFDRISSILAYAALSIPEFFLALVAVYFAASTGWFPTSGLTSPEHTFMSPGAQFLDIAHHLILPTIVLGIGSIAGLMRIMRANFLDVIRAEYVNTARAKGVPEGRIMFLHVLRNAINPLISAFGFAFSSLLSGALMVEIVMGYPGLGRLTYEAFLKQDSFV
ncbi:MAG: ABC transporter permease, partial [Verrucomicrobiota bacterium]